MVVVRCRYSRDDEPGRALTIDHLKALRVLELGASLLRRIGLGPAVDRVGRRIAPSVGMFDVEIDGLRLHGDHIGQLYYVRELLESDREATFIALVKSSIGAGMTVVEAGAHMGYVTLQAARAAGPTGRVIAFEANPRAVDRAKPRRQRTPGRCHRRADGARRGARPPRLLPQRWG